MSELTAAGLTRRAALISAGATALAGATQAGAASAATSVKSKPEASVNVLSFGATGDGTTDDAVAIEAACLALYTAGGGTLYFPPGTYILGTLSRGSNSHSSYITPRNNILFQGGGMGATTLKVKSGQNAAYSTVNKPNIIATKQAGLLTNFAMRDLTFDWNGANNLLTNRYTARNNASLLTIYGAKNLIIERCEFKETPGNQCIYVKNENYGSTNGDGVTIRDCVFRDCGSGLSSNYCPDHSSVYVVCDDVLLDNNLFTTTAAPGTTYGRTCYELHGSRNEARNNKSNNYTRSCYLASDGTAITDLLIDGDQHTNTVYGFSVLGQTNAINNVRIVNSTFRQVTGLTFGATTYFAQGSTVASCNLLSIKNCTFAGQNYLNCRLIQHQRIENFEFSENTVMNFNGDIGIFVAGVSITGSTIGYMLSIQNNKFIDTAHPVYCNQSTKTIELVQIKNNIVWQSATYTNPIYLVSLAAAKGEISGTLYNSNVTGHATYGTIRMGGTQTISVINEFKATATYDPGSLLPLTQTTTIVRCKGCIAGDHVEVSFSNSLGGVTVTGYVSASGTVVCVFYNGTPASVHLPSGTLAVVCNRVY